MPATRTSIFKSVTSRLTRTQIVWAALGLSMTAVAGTLSMIDERPLPASTALTQIEQVPLDTISAIFDLTDFEPGRWDGIVIHHSGSTTGSPRSIEKSHRDAGFQGLGYHFVIGNGFGTTDGEIHVGYRWSQQLAGAHTTGPQGDFYNRRTLGICLIGNGEKRTFSDVQLSTLLQVVAELQERLDIPDSEVVLHRDIAPSSAPGRLFPETAFRARLAELD